MDKRKVVDQRQGELIHQPEQQRFIMSVDGAVSVVDYRISGRTVDFNHTYVPEALRGRGIAESLVRGAVSWAREQGYTTRASCWYASKFLD